MFAESPKTEYPISENQKEEFWQNGHILLRGVADRKEIARFQPAISRAAFRFNTETRNLEERDTYGKAFLQIMNLWRRDREVKNFVFHTKFAQIAADLLGVERVRLYHDQALFKEPQGGHTPWHQDQYYWALDTDKTITMWMPLVDIDEEMGIMAFASGSHKKGALGNVAISDESEETYNKYIAENNFPIAKTNVMKAGDATFHLGWTIHSAGANRSREKTREVMTIIYYSDGARVTPPVNRHQIADIETWMGGRQPGEIADGTLNPVLN